MKNKIKEIEDLKSKFESEISQKNKEIEDLKKQIKEYSNEIEDLKEQNDSMNIEDNVINEKNDSIIIILLIVSIICIFILIYDKYKLNKRNEILNKIVMEYMIQKFPDFNQSVVMEKNENIMIFNEIQNKMNKPIKEIKKLYQATIDGR